MTSATVPAWETAETMKPGESIRVGVSHLVRVIDRREGIVESSNDLTVRVRLEGETVTLPRGTVYRDNIWKRGDGELWTVVVLA